LQRNTRSIPLARIRNVSLHRTLLHRLFGVAEVRLESAGGTSAEAQMRVLSLAAASALERLLHQRGDEAAAAQAAGDVLLALDTAEVVRLGLISNRGMVVVAAGFGALWQLAPGDAGDWMAAVGNGLFGRASGLELGMLATGAAAALLLLVAVLILRLLSVALALLQFHGFSLRRIHGALAVESGLLTRVRAHAPLAKVQLWTVTETLLHRLLGRQSVEVETAVSAGEQQPSARALQHLVPVATPAAVVGLLQQLVPAAQYPGLRWQPLHPRAWRRMAFWPAATTLLVALLLALLGTWWALLPLLSLPLWVLRARGLARRCGYALDGQVVAWRSGWLDRKVSFAEVAKLQGVELLRSPIDRRRGMASVVVDTAGAGAFGHRIHMRYLPEQVARQLATDLAARIARSPLAW
jgi:putative membrane protein